MTGMDMFRFGPGEDLSRAQFATILYRMAGSPSVSYSNVFPDVQDVYKRQPHGWVVINIDGASYICDPEAQAEIGIYNFYMQPINSPVLQYRW